jgi:hypothetical protein
VTDDQGSAFGGGSSTLPLVVAFLLGLAFLGAVVAIVTSGGKDAPAVAATATTEDPVYTTPTVQTVRVSLLIETAGGGQGKVSVNGVLRDCSDGCRLRPYQASTVDLVAHQAKGSTFVGWTGSCGSTRRCLINMDHARSATALFTDNRPAVPAAGPTTAECRDGFDNDGDGAIDDSDYDCLVGPTEEPEPVETTPVTPPPPVITPPPVIIPPPVVPPPPPPPPPPPFVAPPPPPPPPAPAPEDVVPPPPAR